MTEDDPTLVDLAAGCILAVEQSTGVKLDFEPETLPLLDHYVAEAKDSKAEVKRLVAPMVGAYFGEVLRRALGLSRWTIPDADEPSEWRLSFLDGALSFNPVGMALEALLGERVEGWGAHLQPDPGARRAVERAVKVFGDVREEDFFRFGVRFEVVEQAVSALER